MASGSFVSKRLPKLDESLTGGWRQPISTGIGEAWAPYSAPYEYVTVRGYTSVATPGFKSVKTRDLPINGYYAYTGVMTDSIKSVIETNLPNSSKKWYIGAGRRVAGWEINALNSCYFDWSTYSTGGASSASRAEQKALKSMSNMKFNAAQALAERKQTADLLVRSVNRFITVAIAFKRGRFATINRVLKSRGHPVLHAVPRKRMDQTFGPLVRNPEVGDLMRAPSRATFANLWLEYAYGWRPLLNDIYGAAELMAQVATESRPLRSVGSDKTSQSWFGSYSSEGVTANAEARIDIQSRCRVEYAVEDGWLDSAKSTGISNPALIAWELLPYSFVIDWFIPVGDFLERLNARTGLTFIKGSTSTLTRYQASTSISNTRQYWDVFGASPRHQFVQLYRKKLTSFPATTAPSVRLDLNLAQVTSGLALLTQLFHHK